MVVYRGVFSIEGAVHDVDKIVLVRTHGTADGPGECGRPRGKHWRVDTLIL